MKRIQTAFIGIVFCCAALTCNAAVVFDNTTSPTGQVNALLANGEINSFEHGSTVTLASYERIVNSFTVRMRILGAGPATFTMRIRFYRNDGPAGVPGSLLWDSGAMNKVIDSGAELPYTFAVPNVRIPNAFTWSVQVSNRQINMSQMGPAEHNPPSVGSSPFGFWRNDSLNIPNWQFVNQNEPPFSARVSAEPIPGDVNHDATVNILDLLTVVSQWGACPQCTPAACPSDVNGDCTVNIADLLATVANWG